MGVRYSEIPAHTKELARALNEELSDEWRDRHGIEIVAFGISSMKLSEEDEKRIKDLQASATLRDPTMAAATLTGAQAEAMKKAAENQGAGAAMAFMGMNMAQQAGGVNAQALYQMGANRPQAEQAGAVCPHCGAKGQSGKFCAECGKPLFVADASGWTCPQCGAAANKGKFCAECGAAKPAGAPKYKCDKCGWEPADPMNPPRFCPECGDPFNEEDVVR